MVDQALLARQDQLDAQFFADHPDRCAHIRATVADFESRGEFWKLGTHDPSRRRILLWRVPKDNPYYQQGKQPLLKIPFLAFADEEIADRDDILLPIVHQTMQDAARHYGARR